MRIRNEAPTRGQPVFLDRSGRRRRLVLLVGGCVGTVLIASIALLGVGLSGASPVHIPGFPDAGRHAGGSSPEPIGAAPSTGSAEPGTGSAPLPVVTPGSGATASPETTNPRRIPTHTPSHPPKPSKTN